MSLIVVLCTHMYCSGTGEQEKNGKGDSRETIIINIGAIDTELSGEMLLEFLALSIFNLAFACIYRCIIG